MPTYVYSMRRPNCIAHIGTPDRMLCGMVLRTFFQTTEQYPAGRVLCRTCATVTGKERTKVVRFHSFLAERDAFFVNLLRQGLTNDGIVRRLNLGQRTVSRYINEAMYRAKARPASSGPTRSAIWPASATAWVTPWSSAEFGLRLTPPRRLPTALTCGSGRSQRAPSSSTGGRPWGQDAPCATANIPPSYLFDARGEGVDDAHARYVQDAFAEHERMVRALAARFDCEDVEGHVAEAFARCCAAEVSDAEHAVKWVARVAGHLAIDAKRGHAVARRHAPQLMAPATTESAEDRYLDRELLQRTAAAVAALPPDQRDVMLALADGLRASDIAERVGKSVDAVKHVIARSRQRLREQLRDVELGIAAWGARLRRRARELPYGASVGWTSVLMVSPALASALPAAVLVMVSVAGGTLAENGRGTEMRSVSSEALPLSLSRVAAGRAGMILPAVDGTGRAGLQDETPDGRADVTVDTPVSVPLPVLLPVQGQNRGDGKTGVAQPPAVNDDKSCGLEGDIACVAQSAQECVTRGPVIAPGRRIGCPER